jgi:ferredoxin
MQKFRIDINREQCVGDGLCRETAPDTFDSDPEGKSVVIDPQGDEPQYIQDAAEECRLSAITLTDAKTGKRVWPPE